MAVFGVNEIAMRLPGVLLSCAAVWLTFLIGRLLFTPGTSLLRAAGKCALITVIGAAITAPWMLYIWAVFLREAAAAGLNLLMHASQTLEGHDPRPLAYVMEMPRFLGELVWIPLAAVLVAATRDRAPGLRTLLAWVAVPYVTFSMPETQGLTTRCRRPTRSARSPRKYDRW